MKTFTFDTETTGLNPLNSYIISFGANLVDIEMESGILTVESENNIKKFLNGDDSAVIVKEFYQLLNWFEILGDKFRIPEDTIEVHGITEDILRKDGIHPIKVFENLYDFLDPELEYLDNCDGFVYPPMEILNAFNLSYDMNMIRANLLFLTEWIDSNVDFGEITKAQQLKVEKLLQWFTKSPNNGYDNMSDGRLDKCETLNQTLFLDSMTVDKVMHFEKDGVKLKHSLDSVGKRYGIPEDLNAHNALADTRRLTKIWLYQMVDMKDNDIPLNPKFETRVFNKYTREQAKWKSNRRQSMDYYGFNISATK